MSIESLDLKMAISLIGKDDDEQTWVKFDSYHRDALLRLQQSGAALAAIASNTPHIRYDSIIQGIDVPVVDMFTAIAEEATHSGFKHVLILGTPLTMKSQRFKNVLSSYGISTVPVTDEDSISEIVELIGRLQAGVVDGCAETLGRIVKRLWISTPEGQPCVILSCTELPLAFPEKTSERLFQSGEVVYIDSTAVHIRAILNQLI
jgi:aspartate racemase